MIRHYRGFIIHRAGQEKTVTIWRDGRCLESGLKGMNAAREWINARLAESGQARD